MLSGSLGARSRVRASAAFMCAAAMSTSAIAAPPLYTLSDLGTLIGNQPVFFANNSQAFGINNFGQISGRSDVATPQGNFAGQHAFLWTPDVANGTNGSMLDLGPTGSAFDVGAIKVNDFGQVMFNAGSTLPGVQRQPFLWTPASRNGTFGSQTALVAATADGVGLNNLGQVVGRMSPGICFAWTPHTRNGISGSINHHFDPSRQQDLPGYGFGACTNAFGINDAGQVTGTDGVFFWSRPLVHANGPVSFPNLAPLDFGAIDLVDIIGPNPSDPNDQSFNGGGISINTAGHVVGATTFPNPLAVHPFFFDGTSLRDLSPIPGGTGQAWGINGADQVVGQTTFPDATNQAFFFDGSTTFRLLDLIEPTSAAGWSSLSVAYAINDRGQIAGVGVHNGQARAFLATPIAVACAADVTAQLSMVASGFVRVGFTTQFRQTITITNTGATNIAGPVSLAIDNLGANAVLINKSGTTSCAAPAGSSYVNFAAGLNAGASVTSLLVFDDPTFAPITYSGRRALGGSNPR
jgi:probable HAF family extracellular repeat protein